MKDETLGIIGMGYVGQATYNGFSSAFAINTYDTAKASTFKTIEEICKLSSVIFVCVPTPMKDTGECDTSIVRTVLQELNNHCSEHLVVLKSTIPPKTTKTFAEEFENLSLVFNPEFLTESNYLRDFIDCNRVILGGHPDSTQRAKKVYQKRFSDKTIIETTSTVAEMVKYVANTFLATKVSFANEMKQICDVLDTDYDEVVRYATLDERLGHTHWSVPGPDGHYGFGGSCFPKDINGLIYSSKSLNYEPLLLEAVWSKNLKDRPEKDWEDLVGRAVSKGDQDE